MGRGKEKRIFRRNRWKERTDREDKWKKMNGCLEGRKKEGRMVGFMKGGMYGREDGCSEERIRRRMDEMSR